MADKNRLTFSDACQELGITEDELEQLVANGEIASIKEGDTFFFKPDAVEKYKKSQDEPTIILADEDMDLLDALDDMDLETTSDTAPQEAVSQEMGSEETGSEEAAGEPAPVGADDLDLDILELEDDETTLTTADAPATGTEPEAPSLELPEEEAGVGAAAESTSPDDTVLNLDGLLDDDEAEGTTPIPGMEISAKAIDDSGDLTVEGSIDDETLLDTDILDLGDDDDSFKLEDDSLDAGATEVTEATLLRGGGARAMQMKRKKSHAPWTVLLVMTVIILLAPLAVTLNVYYTSSQDAQENSKAGQWVLDANEWTGGMVNDVADLFLPGG